MLRGVEGVSTQTIAILSRAVAVLNAWRRRRSQHEYVDGLGGEYEVCSTPGGVGGVSTLRTRPFTR